MAFRPSFSPVLDGALVTIGDGVVRKRAIRFEVGEYTPPVIMVTDTGVRSIIEALPWQSVVRCGQARVYAPAAPAKPTGSTSNITSDGARLTLSAFSDPNAGETHLASRYQVATDEEFTDIIYDSGYDATDLLFQDVAGLPSSTPLWWRGLHRDNPL